MVKTQHFWSSADDSVLSLLGPPAIPGQGTKIAQKKERKVKREKKRINLGLKYRYTYRERN